MSLRAALRPFGSRGAKQVPVWLRQPMNQGSTQLDWVAQGCALPNSPLTPNCHPGRVAIRDPAPKKLRGSPASIPHSPPTPANVAPGSIGWAGVHLPNPTDAELTAKHRQKPRPQSDRVQNPLILPAMEYALQPHLYRNVPVYLWPWLFWQLFAIALWVEQTGRDVMLAVARNGRVHIRHISQDPDAPSAWSPRDLGPLLPHQGQQLMHATQTSGWFTVFVGPARRTPLQNCQFPTIPEPHPELVEGDRDLPQPRPP